MKLLLIIFLFFGIQQTFSNECECLEKSHKEDFQQANFIVRGLLISSEESTKNKPMYNFTIESIYKNNTKTPIDKEFKLKIHLNHHESCRPQLKTNKSYIFYVANLDKDIFYLHSCHRMYEVSNEFVNSKRYIELLELSSVKEAIIIPKQKTPKIEKFNKKLPNGKFGKLLEKHHPEN